MQPKYRNTQSNLFPIYLHINFYATLKTEQTTYLKFKRFETLITLFKLKVFTYSCIGIHTISTLHYT